MFTFSLSLALSALEYTIIFQIRTYFSFHLSMVVFLLFCAFVLCPNCVPFAHLSPSLHSIQSPFLFNCAVSICDLYVLWFFEVDFFPSLFFHLFVHCEHVRSFHTVCRYPTMYFPIKSLVLAAVHGMWIFFIQCFRYCHRVIVSFPIRRYRMVILCIHMQSAAWSWYADYNLFINCQSLFIFMKCVIEQWPVISLSWSRYLWITCSVEEGGDWGKGEEERGSTSRASGVYKWRGTKVDNSIAKPDFYRLSPVVLLVVTCCLLCWKTN